MQITHEVVTDEAGNPTAAILPWGEFEAIVERLRSYEDDSLDSTWRAELERRRSTIEDGSVHGLSHAEAMIKTREQLAAIRAEAGVS